LRKGLADGQISHLVERRGSFRLDSAVTKWHKWLSAR
jgi:hypothetical protein